MINHTINDWEVIEKNSGKKSECGRTLLKCKCLKCGAIKYMPDYYLKRNTQCESCEEKYANSFIGRQFNYFKVMSIVHKKDRYYAKCVCECGNEKIIPIIELGNIKSCGCKNKELRNKYTKYHGLSKTRIYNIYRGMLDRCYNLNDDRYCNYGAKGVYVCDEWLNKEDGFIKFYNWSMSHGYNDNLSIDRINVYGYYCPENCRWVTNLVQMNNLRNNVRVYLHPYNKFFTLTEISMLYGIERKKIENAYYRGCLYNYLGINKINPLIFNRKINPLIFRNKNNDSAII